MPVKLLADNDLNRDIVRGLLRRCPEIDFAFGDLHRLTDQEVLELAAREGRILVTHEVSTIAPLFASLRNSMDSPGVILIPQTFPLKSAIERLHEIWQLTGAEDWRNRLCYLPSLSDFIA
jgi:hypothetical protein